MVSVNYLICLFIITLISGVATAKTNKYFIMIIPAIAWGTLLFK